MASSRAIVLRAAGINCDQESRAACEKVGFKTDVTHVNRLIENRKLVHDYQFLIVPGGFSFGDDLSITKVKHTFKVGYLWGAFITTASARRPLLAR